MSQDILRDFERVSPELVQQAADEGTAQSWAERISRVVEAELKL